MSQTYKATGINLKSVPLGEADRILTILTREFGLVRAVASGARKPKSKLGGRGELFVVNHLMLSKGRSLDRIAQAETIESYPALSRNLAKLTVGQYWAETILNQTSSHDTTGEVFDWLCQRLADLAASEPGQAPLVHLLYGIVQLLHLGGILPQVDRCCLSGQIVDPGAIGSGRVVFSPLSGGVVLPTDEVLPARSFNAQEQPSAYGQPSSQRSALTLSAPELMLLQQLFRVREALPQAHTPPPELLALADSPREWLKVEQALRHYVQYHTDRPIRSAALLESCFPPSPNRSFSVQSDSITVAAACP
ncbi:DNA repair protein RecO [Altericista sp. CCNU0014]|uniref:DNA repair protein RecO n=1 Tax=Altericista sp. CCNU0014 TaxID=3082949 RepID=UPI003850ADA7